MADKLTPKFELLVDGSPVDAAMAESVVFLTVHKRLDLADMLEVRLGNDDLAWTESDALSEGKAISLKLGYEEVELVQVFSGEITRRDCVFPLRGPAMVTVVAYDKKHQLKRGKPSKTYLDMKDSDIVSAIASEVGLSADVDATTTTHAYVLQKSQTHLAFLADRAHRVGYAFKIDCENSKLTFKKPDTANVAATLKWGENLRSFSPRMSTADQVSKVIVQGWDVTKKERIQVKVEPAKIELQLDGAKKGAELAPKAELLMPTTPVRSAEEATALGESIINVRANLFCQGSGSCQGDPNIDTGGVLEIDGVGRRAGGQYFIREVLHHLEPAAGYHTRFGVIRATESKDPGEREELPKKVSEVEEADGEGETFVEVTARSETGESLEGVSYTVTLPSGEQKKGTLDETQKIRIEGVRDVGECKIELDPPEGLNALE